MTLTPLMVSTMVIGIPIIVILIAVLFLENRGGKKGVARDPSRYTTINMHPLLVLALIFATPFTIAYLAWLVNLSPLMTIAAVVGIPFIVLNIIRLFATKPGGKEKSKDRHQHQPAPTLRSHPPGVTTSRPRRAHRARVASAAKGK